jgi:phospholipid/cholesterol/gamma-HCH transport system permease protein
MTTFARQYISDWLAGLGQGALLCREIFRSLRKHRPSMRDVVYHLYFIGVKSQSVVAVTGGFTGMVLCAQSYIQFHKLKLDTATLALVSVSMCAELGPVLTGLMVSGRVGAAIAAEIGTMRVTEQIDALRTLAAHPVDYLVTPRFLATLLATPLLTAESISLGILSAYLLGTFFFGISATGSWYQMLDHTGASDVVIGMIKACVFGGIIAVIACHKGLTCSEGAEGVGRATTEAVVYSSISILISNFFLTLLLTRLLGGT